MKHQIKTFLLLHVLLLLMSFTGILSKIAGRYSLFSLRFFFLYGAMIIILFVYAVGWQRVLKRMDLTIAYANRACSLVYSLVFGAVIFHEQITFNKILGCVLAVVGVMLYISEDKEDVNDS